MQSPWEGIGRTYSATATEPWVLDAPDSVWIVEDGALDVFAVPIVDGKPAAVLTHIFRATPGDLLLSAKSPVTIPNSGSLRLVLYAVPAGTVELRKVSVTAFDAALRKDASLLSLGAHMVERWIDNSCLFYDQLFKIPPPRHAVRAVSDEALALEEDEALVVKDVPVFMRVLSGSVMRGGYRARNKPELSERTEMLYERWRAHSTHGAGGPWFPLSSTGWLITLGECKVETATVANALMGPNAWKALAAFGHELLHAIEVGRREELLEALTSAKQRAMADKARIERALGAAAELVGHQRLGNFAMNSSANHLVSACRITVSALRGKGPKEPRTVAARHEHTVAEVSRTMGIRTRPVTLVGDWWRRDNGPLLCFFKPDSTGGKHRPVAVISKGARRYDALDPADHTKRRITADIAAQLEPTAHMFYEPLPESNITAMHVLSMTFRGRSRDIWTIVAVSVLGAMLSWTIPLMTGMVFGTIVPGGMRGQLVQVALGLIVVGFASSAFKLTRSFAMLRIEGKADNAVESAVWDRTLSLPFSFFHHYTAGDLANRADGINAMRRLLSTTVFSSLLGGVFSIFTFVLMLYYSWQLTILAVVLASFASIVSIGVGWGQLQFHRHSLNLQGQLAGMALQYFSALGKLRIAGAESRVYGNWISVFLRQVRYQLKAGIIGSWSGAFNAFFMPFCTLASFALYFWFLGTSLSTGDFLAYHSALGMFLTATLGAAGSLVSLINALPLYERAKPILDTPIEVATGKDDPGAFSGKIELRDVGFTYQKDVAPVLSRVNMQIEEGEFVAIVGASGAGKSTLVRLLLGFERATEGRILFDGKEIGALDLAAVRRQLGVVLQDGKLIAGDIFHNIAGPTDASEEEVWAAAESAGIADDIRALPMQMHTQVAEGGATFSGGQSQGILIARAIVHRPPILIFDEATSDLDNTAQARISANLQRLDATRIVVAHRLSTIEHADRIYVLDAGQVVQTGTYKELIAKAGLFQELCKRQLS